MYACTKTGNTSLNFAKYLYLLWSNFPSSNRLKLLIEILHNWTVVVGGVLCMCVCVRCVGVNVKA